MYYAFKKLEFYQIRLAETIQNSIVILFRI